MFSRKSCLAGCEAERAREGARLAKVRVSRRCVARENRCATECGYGRHRPKSLREFLHGTMHGGKGLAHGALVSAVSSFRGNHVR